MPDRPGAGAARTVEVIEEPNLIRRDRTPAGELLARAFDYDDF